MKEFTVSELRECLENLFEKVKLRDYENSAIKAASRCFYEYEPIMNDGLTEKVVCSLIIGKLIANSNKGIYVGQYNIVKESVEKALNLYDKLDLNPEEKKEIFLLAQELNVLLDGVTIEYDLDAK
jgi:hypothetical protein